VRAAVGRNCGPVIRRASLDRKTLGGASPVGHQCPHHTLPDALVKYHLDVLLGKFRRDSLAEAV
jgi:hypothetical protein